MTITTTEQLEAMREANRATTRLLRELEAMARPEMTTRELDDHARAYIANLGGEPVFETQAGFPGAINTNRNDVVVHGVPGDEILEGGDILTIDAGMLLGGVAGDAATPFAIGTLTPRHEHLMNVTRAAMLDAIAAAKTGARVGDVSWAMQSRAERHGCSVARDFCGHGIGTHMWEEPNVPFAGEPGTGPVLREGMVITIEPVVIEGDHAYYMANEWEARTVDGSWVAQYERAVMVTRSGGVILSGD
jgi:methionyl aminopeptidase